MRPGGGFSGSIVAAVVLPIFFFWLVTFVRGIRDSFRGLRQHGTYKGSGFSLGNIDWGDLAAGDRAADLAAVWWLLPAHSSRVAAMARCASVSAHTWERARGWALLLAVILLDTVGASDARMATMARRTLEWLSVGP